MADTDMVMVSDMEVTAMLTIMARDPLKLSPKLMPDICMEVMDMADMVVMDMDADTDTVLVTMVDTDTVSMVSATGATPDTITARDPLMPNPRLMPDICTEVMDMADMVAMDTDVDTDTVLVTMVDTDMVVVFTDTDGDVRHSQVQLSIFL